MVQTGKDQHKCVLLSLAQDQRKLCEQIPVPVTAITESTETDHAAIRIVTGDLKVEISSDVPSEKITAMIGALKC